MTEGVVYKTTNGGADWSPVWRGDNLARYIWIDPTDTDTVYASTGIFDREAMNSDHETGVPGGEGVIKTIDGGATWNSANEGLSNLYIGSLFMHPDDPQVLLAAAGNQIYDGDAGVYLTVDGAETWTPVLLDPINEVEGFHSVEFALSDPDIAYAASSVRVYRSADGGRTWTAMTPPGVTWGDPPIRGGFPIDIQVDPRDPDRLFINAYGGGNFLSTDSGRTWTVASTGYTGAQIRGIEVDPEHPGRVWVTGRSGMFASTDGGHTWTGQSPFDPLPTFEGMALAIAPDGSMLEADSAERGIAFGDGKDWDYTNLFLPDRQAVRALAFAPSDPTVAYAGIGAYFTPSFFDDWMPGAGIYRSDDSGRTWRPANDELIATAHVSGVAVDPGDPDRVFAATVNQGLVRSEDGGASWRTVSSRDDIAIFAVAVNPSDPDLVFSGSRGMFRSTDGGDSWTRVAAGAPESSFVDYVFDPANPDVMYAADITSGVYRSTDAGLTWLAINGGLLTRAVNALAISHDSRHLYAGTEGGGVFRLDLAGTPPAEAPFPTIPTTTTTVAPTTTGPETTSAASTTTTLLAAQTDEGASTPWLPWVGGGVVLVAAAVLDVGRRRRHSG
ncbi:MAG: hypothetical protein HKO87_03680 [Acidimicrobiia bacterium]|nr:hypothetical protein [Acidimicrobiia bacterium]